MTKTTPPRFVFHAKVERSPIYRSKFFETKITARHSIAVEAVADFLTSETKMALVGSRLPPDIKNIHLAFRVVCAVLDPAALKLAPGIPRIYLKIVDTQLIDVCGEPLKVLTDDGNIDDELDRAEIMIDTLSSAADGDEYTEPNTGITFVKGYRPD
jgi:hypothetical protein